MSSNIDPIENAITKTIGLYLKHGKSDYIGESVSQIEHAIQCALLAEKGHPEKNFIQNSIIVASFLHDIGHLIALDNVSDGGDASSECGELEMKDDNGVSLGIVGHEGIGENYLRDLRFPDLVCKLVSGHVKAKRYLATIIPEYYNQLSTASQETMKLQGGLMNQDEICEFTSNPISDLIIQLREYDDKAKNPNWSVDINSDINSNIEKIKNYIRESILYSLQFQIDYRASAQKFSILY